MNILRTNPRDQVVIGPRFQSFYVENMPGHNANLECMFFVDHESNDSSKYLQHCSSKA